MKRKAKIYKGKRVVIGNKNLVTKNEIHVNDIPQEGGESGGGGNTPGGGGGEGDTPTPDIPVIGDGKTYLYIKIAEKGRMNVPLYFSQTVANGVTIDWGDGSATQTLSGTGNVNTTHTYADKGEYIISLNPADGCTLGLGNYISYNSYYTVMGDKSAENAVYRNMLKNVEIGKSVVVIDEYAFFSCASISSIVILDGVTRINSNAFSSCNSLTSIGIPNSVTCIDSNTFKGCYSLASIVIPNDVISIGDKAFENCRALQSVKIGNSVTSIGNYAFSKCYSLTSIIIPDNVKSIGSNAFEECDNLKSATIGNGVTLLESTFVSCASLTDVKIGNNVTTLGSNTFKYCSCIPDIIIPSSVTSLEAAFNTCNSLVSIKIPNSVSNLSNYEFQSLKGMAFYDFSQCTSVPILGGTSVFSSIPTDCKIVIPDALYDEWKAATNWSSFASKMIKASEFNG